MSAGDDLTLRATLVGDAGPLNAAFRDAEAGAQRLAATTDRANKQQAASTAQVTSSTQAQAAAMRSASTAQTAAAEATTAIAAASRKAKADVDSMGTSARETANAMRMLPAQLSDIVTGLQGGQAASTVFLQQGLQIRDMFGGWRPAMDAVLSVLTPMRLALLGAGAATTVLALAHEQGRGEASAYARAQIATGNASGAMRSQLQETARSVGELTTNQREAAGVLALMVGTGRVAAQNLTQATTVAIELQRYLGVAVQTTVEQAAALGKRPLEASLQLNEQYRYLTKATYDQIKALQDRGRWEDAANVAQRAFFDEQAIRAQRAKAELGIVERAWHGIADAAKGAWSAILNIGRPDTLQMQLAQNAARLAAVQADSGIKKFGAALEERQLLDERARLTRQLLAEDNAASSDRARVVDNDQRIRDAEEASSRESAVRSARQAQQLASVQAHLQAMSAAYSNAERVLEALRAGALVTERDYYESKREFIRLNAEAELAALKAENDVLQRQQFKRQEEAQRIARDTQLAQNRARMAIVTAKASADTVVANQQEAASLRALSVAAAEYVRNLQVANDARERANARELGGFGRGDRAREQAARVAQIDDQFVNSRRQLQGDRAALRIDEATYQARLAALQAYHQAALAEENAYQAQRSQLEGNAALGFQRATENYLASARNVAGQVERVVGSMYQGMEDAAVAFFTRQKVDWRNLANTIIAELIRVQIRQQIVQASSGGGWFSSLVSLGMNYFSGGSSAPSGFGNLDTGGSLQGRATGGPVQPYNDYWVGEKGPELLRMGSQGGTVVPNHALPGAQGPLNVTLINQTGTEAEASARRRPDGGIEILLRAAKSAIADDIASGRGEVTSAMRNRFGLRDALV